MKSLSMDITFPSLLSFAFPTTVMVVFMSLYTIVDGIFVSRYVGATALGAINIILPAFMIFGSVGTLFGTGGNAIVARLMGEGKPEEGRKAFSMIVVIGAISTLVLGTLGLIFKTQFITLLGANEEIRPYCETYLDILLPCGLIFALQGMFQSFFITAARPNTGLVLTILAGCANIGLDYLFIVVCDMGIAGAALGTVGSAMIPALIGCILFFKKTGTLFFQKFSFKANIIVKAMSNGSSEMVSSLASSLTTLMFNHMVIAYNGTAGVAAISILFYMQYIFSSIFMGFSFGIAPLVSFNLGRKSMENLRKILKFSLLVIGTYAILMFTIAKLAGNLFAGIFIDRTSLVFQLASRGNRLFSPCFLFCGISIFASSFFTALGDGKTSARISFLRTFFFTMAALLLLPRLFGSDGIWLSIPTAEFLSAFVSVYFLSKKRTMFGFQK